MLEHEPGSKRRVDTITRTVHSLHGVGISKHTNSGTHKRFTFDIIIVGIDRPTALTPHKACTFKQGFKAAEAETEVSQRFTSDERGSGSIRAVQPLSPPPPIQTGFGVDFKFGRSEGDSSAQEEGGKSPRGGEDRGLVLPLLATPFPDHAFPRDSATLGMEQLAGQPSSSPSPPEAAIGVDTLVRVNRDEADDGRYGKSEAPSRHTYTSTPFSFPQSKSFGPTTDVVVVAAATIRGAPETLVIPSPSFADTTMAVPVPQVTVVPSTPLGDETFGFEFPPLPVTTWSRGVPAAVVGVGKDGDEQVDEDPVVERQSRGSPDGDHDPDEDGEEDEKSRFTAFVFGGAARRKSVVSPPSPPPPPVVSAITGPPLENRRKRHSHTRSTSISTRAAFIPAVPIGSDTALLTSDPMGYPSASSTSSLSRSPSPSDSLIDARRGEQQDTIDERRRTLFALEGRDAGRGPSAAGGMMIGEGGGDTPRWMAGLQAFAGSGAREGNRTSQRASRRRSRVSVSEKVEIALPPMDEEDLAEGSVVRDEMKCVIGPTSTSNPADGGFPHSPLQAPVSPSGFTARHADARGDPTPVNVQIPATRHMPPPFGFHFPDIISTATGPSAPATTALNGLGIGGLLASTSMASQATNLGTLVEEDESEVAAVEPVVDHAGDAEKENESMLADLVMTPERASQPATGAGISPDVSSATSFKIRPLRLLSMSSNSTSFSSTPIDPDAQSVSSRRSLSIEALRSPSSGRAIEAGNYVPPLALSESSKRFSSKRNSAGMGSKLFSSYTNDFANKRFSVTSNATCGSRVLNEVEDITPHTDKDDSLPSFALRRRSVTVSGQSAAVSGEVDELKQLVAHLEMEKHTMQEDIEGWQSRCQGLEMQLKHEKEQGVFLRERVRKRK
ncbi:hypothetical protein QFC19_003572 [Naganishia cerealis]|uniref:Uncharacterized protein n=1 Tax=Naganishia cerealis TaxID=610337 RepID=A0ACC2W2Q7_9TREE|nr:hypothetical protein QFC19_003572 [Naganishia cerealis]